MNVIITGATGMVGKGVLLECLDDKRIKKILLINRSSIGLKNPKISEIIHQNFTDFSAIQHTFKAYNACFHCMGVSSAGMTEEQYYKLTYTVTEALVNATFEANPNLTFVYVSGEGTDSTEKSKTMWARVKGKTENFIFNKGFKDAYAFRPGVILPKRGIKSKTRLYNVFYVLTRPFFSIMQRMKSVTTTITIGKAMISLVARPQNLKILNGRAINEILLN
ncbi:NAD-dependent epimerase/dehydratase family protein [Maribacter confluentis]|uniref:NAD-dependent epimerase/dehydratase family protein n=1 Tax=Maribacter confluentis TaxID=1656093 RepID=A0ABT8RPK9_9FLAO|nr:NAD-dependent epimerase/dehydratase family protein [Maribacter confluentis]MDO1512412.1 NAD-dependent epimerase/dehydratase family protein [Maribacter confluentis]